MLSNIHSLQHLQQLFIGKSRVDSRVLYRLTQVDSVTVDSTAKRVLPEEEPITSSSSHVASESHGTEPCRVLPQVQVVSLGEPWVFA